MRPIALLGAPVRDGMLLRFEDANAAGGVHSRKLRLVVDAGRPHLFPFSPHESTYAPLESLLTSRDFFGSPEYRFSRDDHLGKRHGRLAQIQDGRWVILTDYPK